MGNMTQALLTEEELDLEAELYETGWEVSQQIQFELKHTHWELEDINRQIRWLNQFSMDHGFIKVGEE